MKKMTLLEMVQNIASALDTDEVNSITDTTESLQIAEIIKETYYEQFNGINIPEFQGLIKLDSYSNVNSPNYLLIPDNVTKILWLRYKDFRGNDRYEDLVYLAPDDFLSRQLQYTGLGTSIVPTVDPGSGVTYNIKSNSRPHFYTTFDDKYLAFDSFDIVYETTMEGTNTIAYGCKSPDFEMSDDFIPTLDGNLFPLLLAESKATAFINLKQVSSAKEEQKARRQRIRMQNDQFRSRQAQYEYWNRGKNFSRNR